MPETGSGLNSAQYIEKFGQAGDSRQRDLLLKAGALQNAILTSANFSIIATDEKGVIQLFNIGAERMLGYEAVEAVNRVRPSDIHDPEEVEARAAAPSLELATPIAPGFEALAFKASRGIEDVYESTYICEPGSRFPALNSVPGIALSANAIPRDIQKGLDAGFASYVTKPIKVTEFMAALDDALALVKPQTGQVGIEEPA